VKNAKIVSSYFKYDPTDPKTLFDIGSWSLSKTWPWHLIEPVRALRKVLLPEPDVPITDRSWPGSAYPEHSFKIVLLLTL
jgi:hypothetical protein